LTPVTLVPMTALIVTPPVPVPELVTVPVWLTLVTETVIPAAVELLLFRIKLPVPEVPPEAVRIVVPLLLTSVVPPLLTAMAPLMVSPEVVLLSVTVVTLAPMPPLIVVRPEPPPVRATVPLLLIACVEKVSVPVVALLLMVRLLVPVTPPLKVAVIAVPVLPMVSAALGLVARMMALAKVRPVVLPANNEAALLPEVEPKVTEPAPKALAEVEVITVPALIVRPEVKVLTPPRVRAELVLF
jgi:hypothetical protein